MFLRHKKILFLFILLGLFLFEVNFAFALEIEDYPPVLGVTMPANPGLPDYARYFLNLGMVIAVSLAALVIIIGGIYWIVSVGSGKITHEGKEWVMAGIKGLVILLCSYLIVSVINPQLTIFKLTDLIPIPGITTPPGPWTPPGPETITYQEIPIGTLTENVLARTMNCYDFDGDGNPIDGDPSTSTILEPTLLNHDRIDCQLKLAEAAETKADKFSKLSNEITGLMSDCSCQWPELSFSPEDKNIIVQLKKGRETSFASLSSPIYLAAAGFDFELSLSDTSGNDRATIPPQSYEDVTVNITKTSGTAAAVNLTLGGTITRGSAKFYNSATGNFDLSSTSCTPNTSCSARLRIFSYTPGTTLITPVGDYQIIITGTAGATSHPKTYYLSVRDVFNYSISFSPDNGSAAPGELVSTTGTVTQIGGDAENVNLSIEGCSSSIATCTLSRNSCSSFPCLFQLNIRAATSAQPGVYPIVVRGTTAGSIEKTATYTLTVTEFDYSLSLLSSEGEMAPNQSVSIDGNVQKTAGSAQSVNLIVNGCPSNTTCTVTPASCTPNCSFRLNITTTGSTPIGDYTLTIHGIFHGTEDDVDRTTTYLLKVRNFGFSIVLSPDTDIIAPGGEATTTITLSKTLGTAQEVSLSAIGPPSSTVTFTPTKCTPNPNCSVQMKIRTDINNTPQAVYSVVVHGKWGDLDNTATYTLTVRGLDPPLGFYVYPISESEIGATWIPAEGAERTKVLRREDVSPDPSINPAGSLPAGVTMVYFDSGAGFIDGGLSPKKVYCYRAWSYAGNKYSTNSVAGCTTTLAPGDPCERNCSICNVKSGPCPRENTEDQCSGDCVNKPCKPKTGGDPCPAGVKTQIEHGSIIVDGLDYFGLDDFRTQYPDLSDADLIDIAEQEITIDGQKIRVIKKEAFFGESGDIRARMKLIDQLRYLKEKIKTISIEQDLNLLKAAENTLGECYLAKPYVEFLKLVEETKKEERDIQKEKPFIDPFTNKPVDISRYCKGFNYNNSQCFYACQKICPSINEPSFNQLRVCPKNDFSCLEQAFYKCPSNPSFNTFQDCLTVCKNQCSADCAQRYSLYPEMFQECNDECNNDSECILENLEKCYVNLTGANGFLSFLKDCADKYSNFADFEKCANVYQFLCEYGSDRYPGYVDCLKEPISNIDKYTSLYLFNNSARQKCRTCGKEIVEGEEVLCVELYPECWKCPPCSRCPECPCLFSSGECGEFSYNDDPLTFYCRTDWWEEEGNIEPFGKKWICEKNWEIPIGETIDETEAWAEALSQLIQQFVSKTEDMLQYIKRIGEERDYCKCDSVCDGNEGCCQSGCRYNQEEVQYQDPETGQETSYWVCYCSKDPCSGNPCLKMINLLMGKAADQQCPKGVEFKGVGWYDDEIKKVLEELKKFSIEGRSEILKKLIYSRKKMDEGSLLLYNKGEIIKALNCERVVDNIIYPITDSKVIINKKGYTGYCYGKWIGKILEIDEPLTDNWFFCEKIKKWTK